MRLFAYFWRCTNDMNSNEDSKNVHVQTIGPWVGGVVDYKCAKSSHQNKNGKLLKLVDTLIKRNNFERISFFSLQICMLEESKNLTVKKVAANKTYGYL